jgi:hypothetical protein
MYEITLDPLCSVRFEVSDMIVVGRGLFGTRGIGELANGRLDGERLRAQQRGAAAADWAMVADDGFIRGDIRVAWTTHDEANLFMSYVAFVEPGMPAFAAVEFETGDERYRWLNRARVVGKGRFDPASESVAYQLYVMT